MLWSRVVVIVLVASVSSVLHAGATREKKDVPFDCSVGEVKSPLSEDERLDTAGLFILLDGAQCNGSLVSWHTCGFANQIENVNTFNMRVLIYRLEGDIYSVVYWQQIISDSQGCKDVESDFTFDIVEGDLMGVFVPNECTREGRRRRCPLQPSLNAMEAVFYRENQGSVEIEAFKSSNNRMNASINVRASIIEHTTLSAVVTPSPSSVSSSSSRGGDIQPVEIACITIGILALALLLSLLFFIIMCIYCRHVKPHLANNNHSNEKSDRSVFVPEYVTADQRATGCSSDEGSYMERFRNRESSDLNTYSNPRLASNVTSFDKAELQVLSFRSPHYIFDSGLQHEPSADISHYESETCFDEPGLKVPDSPHYEFDSDPQHEPSQDTPHYEVSEDYGDPYWEPANMEDELKLQLARLQVLEIPPKDLKLQDHLGSGQFGTVNRGQWCVSEREMEVAVKSLPAGSTEDEKVKFLQEAAIMGQFKHPNILRIHGVLTAEEPFMIVCEMMHKGDLHQHLKLLRPSLSSGGDVPSELPAVLLSFCRQVAAGMGYLAGKSFVHRDLAARNILVSKDDVCKIADFGLSRDLQDEDHYKSHGGKIPVKWTAPEAITHRKYSSTSDVWSYGILLYEIWALGYKPYHELTNSEALQRVLRGYRLPPPSGCPRILYKLMLQCWHPEPESRPSFFEILLVLQRPDFQLLRWSPEDKEAFSEQARTLGGPLEDGKELYNEMQTVYSTPPASSQTL